MITRKSVAALSVAALAATTVALPAAAAAPDRPVQLAEGAGNPCAPKKPANPCSAKGNPCAPKSNPCAPKK
ncbi:MAG TPA: hypothetical protein VMV26_11535 [Alphaproteobacteria bacterium]|jgi:hypothetical protein|nr:hypothetical protein [Alphaproteobacteria bacterium]